MGWDHQVLCDYNKNAEVVVKKMMTVPENSPCDPKKEEQAAKFLRFYAPGFEKHFADVIKNMTKDLKTEFKDISCSSGPAKKRGGGGKNETKVCRKIKN